MWTWCESSVAAAWHKTTCVWFSSKLLLLILIIEVNNTHVFFPSSHLYSPVLSTSPFLCFTLSPFQTHKHTHRNLPQLILALFGGERRQSLQESVHMWNVKYWNCTITRHSEVPHSCCFWCCWCYFCCAPSVCCSAYSRVGQIAVGRVTDCYWKVHYF